MVVGLCMKKTLLYLAYVVLICFVVHKVQTTQKNVREAGSIAIALTMIGTYLFVKYD
jgi:hypothetical protein